MTSEGARTAIKQLAFDTRDCSPVEEAAARFDAEHPELFKLVERFALEAVAAGRKRIGIAAVWERIRWHVDVELGAAEAYKLNNSHRAYYARRFMSAHPEHAELFETRRLRSTSWIHP